MILRKDGACLTSRAIPMTGMANQIACLCPARRGRRDIRCFFILMMKQLQLSDTACCSCYERELEEDATLTPCVQVT